MVGRQKPDEEDDDDKAALGRLDGSLRRSLFSYFRRRTSDFFDLEDMVQDVFERLVKRGGASKLERENPTAYVFETASSVLNDHLRKKITRRAGDHVPFDQNQHGGADFSPEHVLIGREQLARASVLLLQLPKRTREVFMLRRVEAMRPADVAARLGISVSAVEKNMRRAVKHLAASRTEWDI